MAFFREVALGGTVNFGFATNDTGGSGADFTNATVSVRVRGTTASLANAPITAGVNAYLLTHATYPAGCGEVEIAATEANGYTYSQYYGVYLTATCDAEVPTGFLGDFYVTSASKSSIDANARIMDALNSDGAKISSGQSVSTASNVGTVALLSALAAGAIDAAAIAANAIDADALAADAVTEIQSGLATSGSLNTVAVNVAAILVDTGTDGVVVNDFTTAAKALLQTEAADALTAHDFGAEVVGTVSNVNAFTTAAKAELQVEAADALTAHDFATETIGTASNVNAFTTGAKAELQTEAADALTAHDFSAETIGTVSNVNAFTTAAKAELQTEATDALTAFDFSTKTVGTASNAPSAAAIANQIGQRVPDGTSDAGSFDWSMGLVSGRLKDEETTTGTNTASRTLYKPNGTDAWGTYLVNTSASLTSYITGTRDS